MTNENQPKLIMQFQIDYQMIFTSDIFYERRRCLIHSNCNCPQYDGNIMYNHQNAINFVKWCFHVNNSNSNSATEIIAKIKSEFTEFKRKFHKRLLSTLMNSRNSTFMTVCLTLYEIDCKKKFRQFDDLLNQLNTFAHQ